jgi:potassium efflux system protein
MDETESFLRRPLIRLAGGVITPGALLVGLLIVMATVVLSAIVGRGLRRILNRRGLSPGALFATVKIVRYVLTLIGLLVAIDSIGLSLSAVLAASTVLLVGIGFGLQNIAQNFISGLIVLFEQPIRPGDFIKVGDAYGIVDAIGLRATRVITRDQVTIIVPNSELVTTQVINHSIPTSNLRIAISVGVAYGSDTDLVRKTLLAVAPSHAQILTEPAPEVRFEEFGDSSLDFSLLVWISDPREDRRVSSDLRFDIERRFRAVGIEIPFPQRDLHVRSTSSEGGKAYLCLDTDAAISPRGNG